MSCVLLDEAIFRAFDNCANGKGLGGISLTNTNLFHEFRRTFDDSFSVIFKVGCRNKIHPIKYSRIEAEEIFFILFDSVVIKFIQLMHASNNLAAQGL